MNLIKSIIVVYFNVFTLLIVHCSTVRKTWTSNVRYSDVNNWTPRRLPCSKDRVIFPEKSVVFIDGNIKGRQIVVLPMNGQLVIGDNMAFDFNANEQCSGEDIKFIMESKSWYDTYNWNQTLDQRVFSGRSQWNPIPHSDRIPCFYDEVVFPKASSFKVDLWLTDNTNIKSLIINDKQYDTESFARLLETDVGKLLFNASLEKQLVIDNMQNDCQNTSGCSCNNFEGDVFNQICSFETKRCPPVECDDPIKPVGHCCPICGVVIKLKHKADKFSYLLLEGLVYSYSFGKKNYQNVLAYLSKLKDRNLQIVLIDDGTQAGNALKMGKGLVEYLKEDSQANQPNLYSLESIELINSGRSYYESRFGIGFVFLTLFLLALLAGSAFAVYYFYNKQPLLVSNSFTFVRFGGIDSDDRIELTVGKEADEVEDGSSEATRRPIVLSSEATLFTVDEGRVSFENPLFGKADIDEIAEEGRAAIVTSHSNNSLIDIPIDDKVLEE